MLSITLRNYCLWVGLIAGQAAGQAAEPAGAQAHAFNVDMGFGPVARPDCAGDLAQPGLWNRFGVNEGEHLVMLDVQGRETSAVLQTTDVSTWVSCITDQPAGDQNLLGDGAQTLGSDQVWNLSGLEPGSYLLTVYGRAACTAGSTAISVLGDEAYQACEGRAGMPEEAWGSLFVVGTSDGKLQIRLIPSASESEVRLAGLQLKPLGSGSVALLSVGPWLAAVRSEGRVPLSAPSCDRLQSWGSPRLILRGGPVGTNFNVLQPLRAPIQAHLSPTGWHPNSGPAHAAMQWSGVRFWWQLGSRENATGDSAWLWRG
ncbi:MAG: hypothetical protein ACI9X4_002011 [Glaciecola sp.]|jgi:hypothetical protein